MELKVKKLQPDAQLPVYGSDGAACFDLHAYLPDHEWQTVSGGQPLVIPTGLAFEIPEGWAMEIYSRSGHGFKNDIRLANCVGIIDHDYIGEVMVKLTSDGPEHTGTPIKHGDRIAQAKLVPAPQVTFVEVDELTPTERGENGFGSTGA
jgi:dUTP pyrophosphatase